MHCDKAPPSLTDGWESRHKRKWDELGRSALLSECALSETKFLAFLYVKELGEELFRGSFLIKKFGNH